MRLGSDLVALLHVVDWQYRTWVMPFNIQPGNQGPEFKTHSPANTCPVFCSPRGLQAPELLGGGLRFVVPGCPIVSSDDCRFPESRFLTNIAVVKIQRVKLVATFFENFGKNRIPIQNHSPNLGKPTRHYRNLDLWSTGQRVGCKSC